MPHLPPSRYLAFPLIGAVAAIAAVVSSPPALAAQRTEPGVICPVEAAPVSHSWSPDSRRIVFLTPEGQIKILSARFGSATPMTTEAAAGHPVWSTTAERIALLQSEGAEDSDLAYATLYMWDGAGASSVQILASGLSTHLTPVWSPDGGHLLAETVDGDLVMVDSRTGAKKLVYDHPQGSTTGLKGRPAWVSETEVIYQVGAGTLFVVNIDSGASKRWKGSGTYVSFAPQADGTIWALNIDDKKPQLQHLQNGKVIRTIAAPIAAFAGPNSQGKIAAQFHGAAGLKVIDVGTGVASPLTQNISDSAPTMSPDGRAVSFNRRDPGTDAVHLCVVTMPAAGGQ